MKKLTILTFVLLLTFFVVDGFAQKIGYVDVNQVIAKVPRFRKVQEELNKKAQAYEQEMAKRYQEIQRMMNELEEQRVVLSKEKIKQKEELIRQKYLELQKFMQQVYDPNNGLLVQENEKLTKPIVQEIQDVAKKIAQKERFDVIINATSGILIYADPRNDLTQKVINELNKKK